MRKVLSPFCRDEIFRLHFARLASWLEQDIQVFIPTFLKPNACKKMNPGVCVESIELVLITFVSFVFVLFLPKVDNVDNRGLVFSRYCFSNPMCNQRHLPAHVMGVLFSWTSCNGTTQGKVLSETLLLACTGMNEHTGEDLHGLWEWPKIASRLKWLSLLGVTGQILFGTFGANFPRSHKGPKSGVQINKPKAQTKL